MQIYAFLIKHPVDKQLNVAYYNTYLKFLCASISGTSPSFQTGRTEHRRAGMHDLLDFSEIPHELRDYVPDYPIHVLDVCHTADERLLEFPKDLASMFLMIKYQKDFKTLQSVLQSIPELDTVEQETFDTAWNFLDKRMLKFKDKAQNAKGEVNMCVAVDQMLEEGRKQGHERGLSEGRSLEKEFLILKMLKNNLSIDQIAAITDKTADEIQAITENQKPNTTP